MNHKIFPLKWFDVYGVISVSFLFKKLDYFPILYMYFVDWNDYNVFLSLFDRCEDERFEVCYCYR